MKAVADANVLFACMLRDGGTRRAWFNAELSLYAPRFVIKEFLKYEEELAGRYAGSRADFNQLFEIVLRQARLVDDADLAPYLPAVASLSADSKDWLYLACALKEDAALWSNDRGFSGQTRVRVLTTTQLLAELKRS